MKRVDSDQRDRWIRGRVGRKTVLMAGLAVLSACDIPTSAPILEPRFVIPGTVTSLGVEELLPPTVTFMPDAFAIRVSNSVETWTLGELCGVQCAAANGLVVPKPSFTVRLTTEVPLPEGVLSATVRGGAVTLRVANNLNFDPVRPGSGAQGSVVVEIRSDGRVIATRTVTDAMPPASMTDIAVPMQPAQVTGPMTVVVRINSPAGDPVRVDTEGYVMIAAVPSTAVEMTAASIRVEGQRIRTSFTSLDLTDIDETTRSHVREGGLVLRFDNPFEATGDMDLTITPEGGVPIVKSLTAIPPGASTQRVPFTGEELRQMLGHLVRLSANGVVDQTEDTGVRVQPGDVLQIRADLDLTITSDAD